MYVWTYIYIIIKLKMRVIKKLINLEFGLKLLTKDDTIKYVYIYIIIDNFLRASIYFI